MCSCFIEFLFIQLDDAEEVLQEKMPEEEFKTQDTEETNFYELLSAKGLDDAERVLQEPFSCLVKKMPEVELETVETEETVENQETEETKEREETIETEKTKEVEETKETEENEETYS